MTNSKRFLLWPFLALLLAGCQNSHSSESPSDSGGTITVSIDKYVPSVGDTAKYLLSGKDEGKDVDYVLASQPVIFAAEANPDKKTNLSIYSNVASLFGERYKTKGFPQAGLFIKTSLEEDETKKASVESFLKAFDQDVEDLVAGGKEAVKMIKGYSSEANEQKQRFGFTAPVIQNVQKNNGLAFVGLKNNPSVTDLSKFKEPLGVDIKEGDLSKLYGKEVSSAEDPSSLPFLVTCPSGAPAASLARYAADSEHLSITSAPNVKAAFVNQKSDFIVFDSVTGNKLAAKSGGTYKLVRMLTYGNLYVVATGNDKDGRMSDDDNIIGFGEGNVPDLAFKAVYSK